MPKVKLATSTKLLDLNEACEALSKQLGRGFRRSSILRRIDSGEWIEGTHWVDQRRSGAKHRIIKINIDAVLRQQLVSASYRK